MNTENVMSQLTLNRAKTTVAQRLRVLGMGTETIKAAMDMTRDEAILEAAEYVNKHPICTLDDLSVQIYVPQI